MVSLSFCQKPQGYYRVTLHNPLKVDDRNQKRTRQIDTVVFFASPTYFIQNRGSMGVPLVKTILNEVLPRIFIFLSYLHHVHNLLSCSIPSSYCTNVDLKVLCIISACTLN